MKISIGLGWLLTPLRYRRYRRFAAGGLFAMGAFSFVTFDLVPRDGHLSVSVLPPIDIFGGGIDFPNTSNNPVRDLYAGFAFYDFRGQQVSADTFVPAGMTVEANSQKGALLDAELFPPDRSAFAFFCGHFKGSYLIDRVREVWVLSDSPRAVWAMTREHIDMHLEYGQVYYAKSRHFLRKPNCTPPENLTEHAAANGWDFEHFFRQFERAGVIPPPEK